MAFQARAALSGIVDTRQEDRQSDCNFSVITCMFCLRQFYVTKLSRAIMKTKQHTRLLSALTLATLFCTTAPFTSLFCAATAASLKEKGFYLETSSQLARLREEHPELFSDECSALESACETFLRLAKETKWTPFSAKLRWRKLQWRFRLILERNKK